MGASQKNVRFLKSYMQDFIKSPDFFRIHAGTLVLESLTVNGHVKPSGMEMADEEVSNDTVWSVRRPGGVLPGFRLSSTVQRGVAFEHVSRAPLQKERERERRDSETLLATIAVFDPSLGYT